MTQDWLKSHDDLLQKRTTSFRSNEVSQTQVLINEVNQTQLLSNEFSQTQVLRNKKFIIKLATINLTEKFGMIRFDSSVLF